MPARVLVVAASSAVQQLANPLRAVGHEIVLANDVADGWRRWTAERPDLIALDDDLPGPNGRQLLDHIRQAEPAGTHTPIVLIGRGTDVDAKVAALRAGADDYLAQPVHAQELAARVRGLLARFPRAAQPAVRPGFGRVHAYYGAKGGVGTTTLAINTAIALQREQRRRVALIDGNLQFGDHRVFLDMGLDQRSIVDAVSATAIDADVLRRVMVRHESGVDLLLAPAVPEAAELVRSDQHHLLQIVKVLRTLYDYVIIDMDSGLDDHMLDVIGAAERLVVVLTADLSCIKNVRLVLATMTQLGVPDERLVLVLNRANAFTGISTKSVESVLRHPIAAQIVNDYRSAISALNSGAPFMSNRPNSALARGVLDFARQLDQQANEQIELAELRLTPAR